MKVENSLLSTFGVKKSKLSFSGKNKCNYKNVVNVNLQFPYAKNI
jgi:hypothetical protein